MPTDLIIVAAGSGKRLGQAGPKALTPVIVGTPLITTTINYIGPLFENIHVIVKADQEGSDDRHDGAWESWRNSRWLSKKKVNLIPISSGRGDGHALLQGLNRMKPLPAGGGNEEVIVMWGDVYIPNIKIIKELVEQPCNNGGIMPVILEEDPYVTIITEKPDVDGVRSVKSADFKKYGEHHSFGLHDQSIFKFNRSDLYGALGNLDRSLDKDGRYITENGELSTLHTFHYFYNWSLVNAAVSPMKAYQVSDALRTLTFNTPYELEQIKKEINS